jgi:hypothetical protein
LEWQTLRFSRGTLKPLKTVFKEYNIKSAGFSPTIWAQMFFGPPCEWHRQGLTMRIYFGALLSLIWIAHNLAMAAEVEIFDAQGSEYENIKHDFELKVIDNQKQEYRFLLHSAALEQSKYFRQNFPKSKNSEQELYVFHTHSVDHFRRLLELFYGGDIEINNFNDANRFMYLAMQLEIPSLNDEIINKIDNKELLKKFDASEMVELLKLVHSSRTKLGTSCAEILFNYIDENQGKFESSSKKQLLSAANKNAILSAKIERIFNPQYVEPSKEKVQYQFDDYSKKTAIKIYRQIGDGKTVPVSRSFKKTEEVILLLKLQYRLIAVVTDTKSVANKYQIRKA